MNKDHPHNMKTSGLNVHQKTVNEASILLNQISRTMETGYRPSLSTSYALSLEPVTHSVVLIWYSLLSVYRIITINVRLQHSWP